MSFLPIMLVTFCYFLHKMCVDKGISPWGYVGGFVGGFFLIILLAAVGIVFFYGPHVMKDADSYKEVESLIPFAMMFHFLLFLFFRRKIERLPDYNEDDDDNHLPPNDGKKDLSYFR